MFEIGAGLGGGLGSFLGSILGGPSDYTGGGEKTLSGAEDYIKQMYQQGIGQLSPYEQAGRGALGDYMSALGAYKDPTQLYSQIMSGYQQSPAAQFQEQQGLGQLQNVMGAQGLAGSGQEAKDVLQYSQGLSSQDMQQYLNNVLGMGQTYLGGMGGLGQMGYGAAGQMAGLGMQAGQQVGGLSEALANAQALAAQRQAQSASGMGGLLGGALGGALGLFL